MSAAPLTLRQRALRLLAGREHSRKEMERKLGRHAESPEELLALLDELEQKKQLSNTRYADARSTMLARKFGSARIANELRAKGVSAEDAAGAVAAARLSDLERARAVWVRKFRSVADTREERARQMRFLQARGFSFDIIRAVVSGENDD